MLQYASRRQRSRSSATAHGAQTAADLEAIWRENKPTLRHPRKLYPALVTTKGKHFAEIFATLYDQRRAQLEGGETRARPDARNDAEKELVGDADPALDV